MNRLVLRPLVVGLALLLAATALVYIASQASISAQAASVAKGDPKDCDDFRNQKKAQKWFRKHNPRRDPAGLDADNDGIACEDNPCPCSHKSAAADSPRQLPARRSLVDSYCSPSGDYCTAVKRRRGRIKFELATFSFDGAYDICVKPPSRHRDCQTFRLQEDGDLFVGRVDWQRRFGNKGAGTYGVRFKAFGSGLGPKLFFDID